MMLELVLKTLLSRESWIVSTEEDEVDDRLLGGLGRWREEGLMFEGFA